MKVYYNSERNGTLIDLALVQKIGKTGQYTILSFGVILVVSLTALNGHLCLGLLPTLKRFSTDADPDRSQLKSVICVLFLPTSLTAGKCNKP